MTAYLISIATFAGFFMILALALNLQWGMTGMVNFGIAGFYAMGAYTSGLLSVDAGWPFPLAFLAAGLMALVFGIALALMTVRLSDDYLAIVTLGFAELVRLFILNEDWLTYGPRGLPIENRPLAQYFDRAGYGVFYLLLVASVILVIFLINERIRKSPYGRVVKAIREDDLVARTLGKDVLKTRIQIFALGAFFMGLAGSLNAHYIQNISPDAYTTSIAILIWMSVIVGGAGNNKGLIIGAGLVMTLLEGTRFLGELFAFLDAEKSSALRIIIISVMLIVVVRFRPEGILPEEKYVGRKLPKPAAEQTNSS